MSRSKREVFLYFSAPTGVAQDELEDMLEECLGELGEVTGAGAGEAGNNFDLEVDEALSDGEIEEREQRLCGELKITAPFSLSRAARFAEEGAKQ